MYKLSPKHPLSDSYTSVMRLSDNVCIPFDPDNTDYQAFKTAVLEQQPGGAVVEDGNSFSLNTSPDDSILEDADGNVMTIDQAKAYVRTLP
jgi:hypothetical protein